jgi:hypothetical protein
MFLTVQTTKLWYTKLLVFPLSVVRTLSRSTSAFLLCLVAALLLAKNAIAAQPPCSVARRDLPVGSALASAGFFANLRNARHSINYTTDELLTKARRIAQVATPEPRGCKDPCTTPVVAIVFTSTPNLVLDSYDESTECQRYFEETRLNPIVYEKRAFDSEEEAKEWYHDLTRGSGEDGEDLYTRCPGMCSPAYSSVAYKQGEKFIVTATVVCGHARDKDDDQYKLTASVRWICPR